MSTEEYLQQQVKNEILLLTFIGLDNIVVDNYNVFYLHGDSKVFWNPKLDYNQLMQVKDKLQDVGFQTNIYDNMVEVIHGSETVYLAEAIVLNKALYKAYTFVISNYINNNGG